WVAESVAGEDTAALTSHDPSTLPRAADPSVVRPILSRGLGVLRDRDGIADAIHALYPIARGDGAASDPAIVGLMMAVSALRREESRGGHYRTDRPETLRSAKPSQLSLADALAAAHDIANTPYLRLARS